MWTVRTLRISAKRDMDKRKTLTNSTVHAYKVVKKTDEHYFKSASQSLRCTCSKLCVGKYRKIILLHTAAVLRSYSRVPSIPKNLCVVLVGCRRRMFQQQEIVSIKLVTRKNIGPPSSKGLWFVWKGYFNQLCNLMESKVSWTLNWTATFQITLQFIRQWWKSLYVL